MVERENRFLELSSSLHLCAVIHTHIRYAYIIVILKILNKILKEKAIKVHKDLMGIFLET